MYFKDIIYPVLFPFVAGNIFEIATKNSIEKYDVYINYNYQKIHLELEREYIAPELMNQCRKEIDNVKEQTELMDVFNKSHYTNYYKYFLCLSIREGFDTIPKFKRWLENKRYFSYYEGKKPNYIYEILRTYHMIIIPEIPDFSYLDNMFNRIHNCFPNYVQPKKLFNECVDHLVEGGKIYVLDEKSQEKVVRFKNELIKRENDELFRKKLNPKPKNEFDRAWL